MRLYQKVCVACGTPYETTNRNPKQCTCGKACATRLRIVGIKAAAARKRAADTPPPPEQGVRFISLTRGEFAKVDTIDFEDVSQWNWQLWVDRKGRKYAARGQWTRHLDGKRTYTTVFLHRHLMRAGADEKVDHTDGNGLDNRRNNMRKASSTENNRNRKKRSGVASKYKGVAAHYDKWAAAIWVSGRKSWLGRFDTEEGAARAYDEAARRHFGKFACVNFPIGDEQGALH